MDIGFLHVLVLTESEETNADALRFKRLFPLAFDLGGGPGGEPDW